MVGCIVGALFGAAYFFQHLDPADPNASLFGALLVMLQFAGAVGALELLIFLYRPHVRRSTLLKSRHNSLVVAVFVLFVLSVGRLVLSFLPQ